MYIPSSLSSVARRIVVSTAFRSCFTMSPLPATYNAIELEKPKTDFRYVTKQMPEPTDQQVLIEVKAFGLNRSELHTRHGLAVGVIFPRVLGIECCGVVAKCPGGQYQVGQPVVAMMGGMGRQYDGGYAEYACVPVTATIPFKIADTSKSVDWGQLGAIPEMLQTSYGSLTTGCDGKTGESILIRGGTSSVGMTIAVLAKHRGMTVISTTRNPKKTEALKAIGVDHVIIDTAEYEISSQVRKVFPNGVNCAVELIGTPALKDTLRCVAVKGTVCFTGMLSNQWIVNEFYPIEYIPTGVRLTAYGGNASDLDPTVLQQFVDDVLQGKIQVPIHKRYAFQEVQQAHTDMENGVAAGKLVVEVKQQQ